MGKGLKQILEMTRRLWILGFIMVILASCQPMKQPPVFPPPASSGAIYVGYGEGVNRFEAVTKAIADISLQLGSKVWAVSENRIVETDETVSRWRSQEVRLKTASREIRGKIIHHGVTRGTHCVAMEVDMRPDAEILAEAIRRKYAAVFPVRTLNWKGPDLLTKSFLICELERLLVSRSGGTLTLPVSLSRKSGTWVVSVGGCVKVAPDLADILDFSAVATPELSIALQGENGNPLGCRLRKGDVFRFSCVGPEKTGYLTLFNLYADGRVG